MFPIYCKHCGKATGRWKEAQDVKPSYLQDHCGDCVYVHVVPTEAGLTIPACKEGILACILEKAKRS